MLMNTALALIGTLMELSLEYLVVCGMDGQLTASVEEELRLPPLTMCQKYQPPAKQQFNKVFINCVF